MSVQFDSYPASGSLSGSEGELVSIHVCVEPRMLEKLLDALARLSFPVNPQIFHNAGIGYVYKDGHERREHAIIVEFPAFSENLEEVRNVVQASGLPPNQAHVRSMLEDLHTDSCLDPAPDGADYAAVKFYKQMPLAGGAAG